MSPNCYGMNPGSTSSICFSSSPSLGPGSSLSSLVGRYVRPGSCERPSEKKVVCLGVVVGGKHESFFLEKSELRNEMHPKHPVGNDDSQPDVLVPHAGAIPAVQGFAFRTQLNTA